MWRQCGEWIEQGWTISNKGNYLVNAVGLDGGVDEVLDKLSSKILEECEVSGSRREESQ